LAKLWADLQQHRHPQLLHPSSAQTPYQGCHHFLSVLLSRHHPHHLHSTIPSRAMPVSQTVSGKAWLPAAVHCVCAARQADRLHLQCNGVHESLLILPNWVTTLTYAADLRPVLAGLTGSYYTRTTSAGNVVSCQLALASTQSGTCMWACEGAMFCPAAGVRQRGYHSNSAAERHQRWSRQY
jgi:hypothetical protein